MPIVDITILEGRSPEKKLALMEKVTDAVVEAIDAPREAVRVLIREIPAEHFAVAGKPKKMPASAQ